jgi:hypothetical protein
MYPTYVTDVPKIKNIENPLEDLKSITLKSDSQRNKTLPKKKKYHHQKVETNLRYKDTIDSESNTTNFPSIGFTSTSERFENNNSNMETPGPGTYNSPSSFKQSFKSFSSKGYLNGFLSKEDRFDKRDGKLFYERFKPGPGNYQLFNRNSLYEEVKKSLIGKNLYNNFNSSNNIKEDKKPDPCTYDPIKPISESYKQDNLFNSKIIRFKMKFNNNPGPGTYYNRFKPKNKLCESAVFKKPIDKKIDIYKLLKIKTDDDVKNEYLDMKKNKDIKNNFDLSKTREIYFKKNYSQNFDNPKINNLQFDLGENIDTHDIKPYEFTTYNQKDEIMKLASPRWKDNKYEFKVPGPAYYKIRTIEKHLSFNRNDKIFNSSPGVIYKYYENK